MELKFPLKSWDDSKWEPLYKHGRSWTKYFVISLSKSLLIFSNETYLKTWNNEPTDKLGNYVGVGIEFNPTLWEISETHVWYDGPHCFYNWGPFSYSKTGGYCKKCHKEVEP